MRHSSRQFAGQVVSLGSWSLTPEAVMLEYRYKTPIIVALGFSDSASVLTLLVSMHRTMVAQQQDLEVEGRAYQQRALSSLAVTERLLLR
jgi:hypothetical protein